MFCFPEGGDRFVAGRWATGKNVLKTTYKSTVYFGLMIRAWSILTGFHVVFIPAMILLLVIPPGGDCGGGRLVFTSATDYLPAESEFQNETLSIQHN